MVEWDTYMDTCCMVSSRIYLIEHTEIQTSLIWGFASGPFLREDTAVLVSDYFFNSKKMNILNISQMLHVWNIYLHLPQNDTVM